MSEKKKGIVYGIGVGPGDPELMTLKACRLIRENEVIAVPGEKAQDSTAYRIALKAVPELAKKELVEVCMPMVKDQRVLRDSHAKAAAAIESYLDIGRNVVWLTLGDPTVYSSFSYIRHMLEFDGYTVELVSGITSFCAAAARLGVSLAERDESLHVMPALYNNEKIPFAYTGSYVFMKPASKMPEVKKMLAGSDFEIFAVENCGMDDEKLYSSAEEIPDDAGYFTTIIAKQKTAEDERK